MAESERIEKEAAKRQAGHALGRDTRIRRIFTGDFYGEDFHSLMANLPLANVGPVDLITPEGGGKLYFIEGISDPDGPDVPLPPRDPPQP